MKSLLREPLIHFLLIGAVLFSVYQYVNDEFLPENDQREEIVVSEGQIDALITGFERVWQRLPSQFELEGLLQSYIREEVMYREAMAMGLDRNDGIIRRRLQQKLEFLGEDIATLNDPEEAELTDFLAINSDMFREQSRYSFKQIYFNTSERGAQARSDADSLLEQLLSNSLNDEQIDNSGDRLLMSQTEYLNVTERNLQRDLGANFTSDIQLLEVGSWQGPIESGFGLHLIFIQSKTPGEIPSLAAIRGDVVTAWTQQKQEEFNEMFYTTLRDNYVITIEQTIEQADDAANQDEPNIASQTNP